ncbi:hypothetical protein K435DRAFT_849068 [Dendrothele bispora CBS 962.96]|uniref:Uncharacterized protein n=1 Tax=Dendrothele bispora (strain CBS 962.96) TaxID=1314807 RepID=A0A4S8MUG4_DENBC|nr:hypothetical protein K435DRAFT_849068 [Dendrothele bispora CBS 962.96]
MAATQQHRQQTFSAPFDFVSITCSLYVNDELSSSTTLVQVPISQDQLVPRNRTLFIQPSKLFAALRSFLPDEATAASHSSTEVSLAAAASIPPRIADRIKVYTHRLASVRKIFNYDAHYYWKDIGTLARLSDELIPGIKTTRASHTRGFPQAAEEFSERYRLVDYPWHSFDKHYMVIFRMGTNCFRDLVTFFESSAESASQVLGPHDILSPSSRLNVDLFQTFLGDLTHVESGLGSPCVSSEGNTPTSLEPAEPSFLLSNTIHSTNSLPDYCLRNIFDVLQVVDMTFGDYEYLVSVHLEFLHIVRQFLIMSVYLHRVNIPPFPPAGEDSVSGLPNLAFPLTMSIFIGHFGWSLEAYFNKASLLLQAYGVSQKQWWGPLPNITHTRYRSYCIWLGLRQMFVERAVLADIITPEIAEITWATLLVDLESLNNYLV